MLTTTAPGINSGKGALTPCIFEREQIPLAWDELEVFIRKSIEAACPGELTVPQVKELLMSGQAVAFATLRDNRLIMVLTVGTVEYATYNAIRILTCAGRELKDAMQFIDALEAWALTQGAVELEGWCRPAMHRLSRALGWTAKRTLMTRDLRRRLQ